MTPAPEELEAMARAIRAFYSDEPVAVCDGVAFKAALAAWHAARPAIRRETLEEAAEWFRGYADDHQLGGRDAAAAIRALKDQP
jgi:hypothetical protein